MQPPVNIIELHQAAEFNSAGLDQHLATPGADLAHSPQMLFQMSLLNEIGKYRLLEDWVVPLGDRGRGGGWIDER